MAGNKELGPPHFAVHLSYDDTAAARARALLTELLTRYGVRKDLMDDATLVLHELVINGLMHGEPDDRDQIAVSAQISDKRLAISVHDGGSRGTVAAQRFTLDRPDGRGLAMVEVLSDSWSVDRSSGTRVSAYLSI